MFKVILKSDVFGEEEFIYDSEAEQIAAAIRLTDQARAQSALDGIARQVIVTIDQ